MTQPENVDAASHFVASSSEEGLKLHVRVRGEGSHGRPVLFIHGASFSSCLYDLPLPTASWLSTTAAAGFTAYAVDIRGYGLSRSTQMEVAKEPYARADCAVKDINDVVRWICDRHSAPSIRVVGGSWGSIISGLYASTIGKALVSRLVLFAPIYGERNQGWLSLLADPARPDQLNPDWGSFRWISEAAARSRWNADIPRGRVDRWRDDAVLGALLKICLSEDPLSQTMSPNAFRAPNGTFVDLWEAFNARPLYDPSGLSCSVLLIRGGDDTTSTRSDALALFDRVGSQNCTYVEIANGSHFINAEHRAPELFAAVNSFLVQ